MKDFQVCLFSFFVKKSKSCGAFAFIPLTLLETVQKNIDYIYINITNADFSSFY